MKKKGKLYLYVIGSRLTFPYFANLFFVVEFTFCSPIRPNGVHGVHGPMRPLIFNYAKVSGVARIV